MSSITITSHPDIVMRGKKAIMIPTKINQNWASEKSRFHLLSHSELNTNGIFSVGNFTEAEQLMFESDKISIMLIRTSFILENIDIYREELEDDMLQFILPIHLQKKFIRIGKWKLVGKLED